MGSAALTVSAKFALTRLNEIFVNMNPRVYVVDIWYSSRRTGEPMWNTLLLVLVAAKNKEYTLVAIVAIVNWHRQRV